MGGVDVLNGGGGGPWTLASGTEIENFLRVYPAPCTLTVITPTPDRPWTPVAGNEYVGWLA